MSFDATWAEPAPRITDDQRRTDAVWARLTDTGRAEFRRELDTAGDQLDVVAAWHLSMRFATHLDRDAALEKAHRRHGERVRPGSFEAAAAELDVL